WIIKIFRRSVDPGGRRSIHWWRDIKKHGTDVSPANQAQDARATTRRRYKMKYMLMVYLDEQAMTDEEREHCYVESAQLTQDLNAKGQYLGAGPLHSVST